MIGGLGVLTHLATLWLAVYSLGIGFAAGQGIATMVAMTGNFLLNNLFTYRDRRLRGASNEKAKRELNFQPRPLEWLHQSHPVP